MLWHRLIGAQSKAAPSFVGFVSGTDAAGDFTLDISSLTINAGDLGVLFVGAAVFDKTYSIANFTFQAVIENDRFSLFTKSMLGGETSIVSSGGGDLQNTSIVFCLFRGLSYVEFSSAITSTDPDPPAITVQSNDWVLVGGFQRRRIDPISAPSDYTLIASQSVGTPTNACTVAAAYRSGLAAGTENPGIMSSASDDNCGAYSIVLRPL